MLFPRLLPFFRPEVARLLMMPRLLLMKVSKLMLWSIIYMLSIMLTSINLCW